MQARQLLFPAFSAVMFITTSAVARAGQGDPVAGYKLLTTVSLPGGLTGNDISWVDSNTARYYLADRGNTTASPAVPPRIDVIDTESNQFLTSITLPAGANGVLSIPRAHEIWVGLNDSTVAVINTDTNAITSIVSTGGTARADEIAFDPVDRVILIANDRDSPPFVSFISQQGKSVLKKVNYDGSAAPQSTGGIEQPVWDGPVGKFYLAIPATKANANGEVDELDPVALAVTKSFPTTCGPAGLVLMPNQRLMTSCGDVVDVISGKIVASVKGVGGDEIWYNPGDQRVYFGGGTDRISVPVVDANSYSVVTSLVVGQIATAPAVSQTTHSLAADAGNGKVFVPVTGLGVQVWRNGASLTAFPNPIPVTGTADGTTTITWNAPNAQFIEIHIGSPNGPLFTYDGNHGSIQTGPWVSDGLTLYLQDVTGGLPLTAANTLAVLVLHLQKM
jgi:hypothetical protein